MNIRLIFIILIILIFAFVSGYVSYSQSTGIPLKDAYKNGNVIITQNTSAGTVPHQVNIVNNGKDPIKVKAGDVLQSETSQDLVVAENITVKKNATETVMAYCLEPDQQAVPGANLNATKISSMSIKEVIMGSNPKDLQNATDTQVQIWILYSGVNFKIYSGEPAAMVQKQNITFTKLREMVTTAKTEIASKFKINPDQIDNLNQNVSTSSNNVLDRLMSWLKTTTGL
jgi:hypothetical protein